VLGLRDLARRPAGDARRLGRGRRLQRHAEVPVLPPGCRRSRSRRAPSERVRARRTPVQSWYFDVTLLSAYYGSERVYHHTAPSRWCYALAEALRVVEEEGMPAREHRHRAAAAALIERLAPLGFIPLVCAAGAAADADPRCACPRRCGERGEAKLRRRLLDEHGIEVGGGLGKLAAACGASG